MNADRYTDGLDPADDQNILQGIDRDVNGYTATILNGTIVDQFIPRRDVHGLGLNWTFGSSHDAIFNVVFIDGSGRSLEYGIEPEVFFTMGGRNDSN